MSRNNTPSILSTLTAYDSSDSEEFEDNEAAQGQVTLLMPPSKTLAASNPSSREPSPKQSSTSSLAQNYIDDDEENFEFQRDHEEDDKPKEEEETVVVLEEDKPAVVEDKENSDKEEEDDGSPRTKRRKLLLPPAPEGKCAPALEAKFAKMLALKKKGKCANSYIQAMKDFRNPSIYEKFIIVCNIDEHGTNFPDPQKFEASSYYDELEKAQRNEMERRFKEKEKKAAKASEGVKVDFIKGTLPPSIQVPGAAPVQKPPSAYIRAFGNLAFKM